MSEAMSTPLQTLLKLEVPLIVQIAEKAVTVRELEQLEVGAIIAFPKSADEDVTILINNATIGSGRAVKVGKHFGVRVSSVASPNQRLQALGR
jgi:flagellar motor switch protein FliN/FliY